MTAELEKAIQIAAASGVALMKSAHPNHKAYNRTSASGTVSTIAAKGDTMTRDNVLKHIIGLAETVKRNSDQCSAESKEREQARTDRILPRLRQLFSRVRDGHDLNDAFNEAIQALGGGERNKLVLLHTASTTGFDDSNSWAVKEGDLAFKRTTGTEISEPWLKPYTRIVKSLPF